MRNRFRQYNIAVITSYSIHYTKLYEFFLTIILHTVFGQGYWDFVPDESQHKISKLAKIEIEIAVFDALFKENASMIKENATYYYVSIEDSTNKTLPEVLKAFDNNNPQVKSLV